MTSPSPGDRQAALHGYEKVLREALRDAVRYQRDVQPDRRRMRGQIGLYRAAALDLGLHLGSLATDDVTAQGAAEPTASAPGAISVRLLGERPVCEALARILATHPDVEVIQQSGPRANRRDPGVRVYLTIRVPAGGES